MFRTERGCYVPSEHARGPWDPNALHGGAPAALITTAFERLQHAPELRIARLSFELLRPIPFEPLSLAARVMRGGRRVQELAAELSAGGKPICRAMALRVREVPAGLPASAAIDAGDVAAAAVAPMAGPEEAVQSSFTLDRSEGSASFAAAMDMRWLTEPAVPGPAQVWMRLRQPLLDGERASPLATLAATADFGNGVSAVLPFDRLVFINADLSIHLHREPRGEWAGLHARTLLRAGEPGLAECVLHDAAGRVGRSLQTLAVDAS